MNLREGLKSVKIHEIYLFAFFLLIVMTVSNSVTFYKRINLMIPSEKFSGVIGLIFNILWAFFFWWLWQNAIPKPQEIASTEKMLEVKSN